MFQHDWIMRQIQMAIHFIVKFLFGRDAVDRDFLDETYSGTGGELLRKLDKLVDKGKINQAEDKLFEAMSPGDLETLRVALAFYDRLNQLDDQTLDDAGFDREEIREGLDDITHKYGINIMDLFEPE